VLPIVIAEYWGTDDCAAIADWLSADTIYRRVVLVGDNYQFCGYSRHLNKISLAIGGGACFNTTESPPMYDNVPWRESECSVESHELTAGVTSIWDAATQALVSYDCPLIGIVDLPGSYQGGCNTDASIVYIHDSNIFCSQFGSTYDTDFDRNYRFSYNLCTIFL